MVQSQQVFQQVVKLTKCAYCKKKLPFYKYIKITQFKGLRSIFYITKEDVKRVCNYDEAVLYLAEHK